MRLFKKGDRVKVTFDNSSHIVLEDQKPGYDAVMLDHFTLSGIKGECFVNSEYLKLIVPEHTEQSQLKAGMFVEHKRYGIAKVEERMGGLFLKIPGFICIIAAQPETLKLPSPWTQEKLKADYHAARKRVWEESEAGKAAREKEKSSVSFKDILRSEILKAWSINIPGMMPVFDRMKKTEEALRKEEAKPKTFQATLIAEVSRMYEVPLADLLKAPKTSATGKSYFDSAAEELKKKEWSSYGPGSLHNVNVNSLGQSAEELKKKELDRKYPVNTGLDEFARKLRDISVKKVGADRLNAGKLQWSLVDFTALEPMVRVLMKGAKKYSPDNWKKGLSYTSILDSTMRHLTAFKAGEDLDPETGEPHTAHMLCNLMFLAWMELNRKDLDNRKPDLKC